MLRRLEKGLNTAKAKQQASENPTSESRLAGLGDAHMRLVQLSQADPSQYRSDANGRRAHFGGSDPFISIGRLLPLSIGLVRLLRVPSSVRVIVGLLGGWLLISWVPSASIRTRRGTTTVVTGASPTLSLPNRSNPGLVSHGPPSE